MTASAKTASGRCGETANWAIDTNTGRLDITGTGQIGPYGSRDAYGYYEGGPRTGNFWMVNNTYAYANNIKDVYIDEGITGIASEVFYANWRNGYPTYIENLETIHIPTTLEYIYSSAFYKYPNIYISDLASWCQVNCNDQFGDLYLNDEIISGELAIPDNVTKIGTGVFYSQDGITSVKIPSTITSIGKSAFSGCTEITDVWYTGSESDKSNISIASDNDALLNATWHYNTCTGEHSYSSDCDMICDNCDWTRIANSDHTYESNCDNECNLCYGIRVSCVDHTYDNNCDANCNECGETRIPSNHVYDNNCDEDCNECGDIRVPFAHVYNNTCDTTCDVCGYIRTITHTYSSDCDRKCDVCQATRTSSVAHTYDNTCDTTCNKCSATRTISHTYDSNCDRECNICRATRSTSAAHSYSNTCDTICNYCGYIRTITHTYTNNCDTTCNVCSATRTIFHSYSGACDTICNVCSATRTTSVSHTYTNNCDTSCNVCSTTRTISHSYSGACDIICNVCSATRTTSVSHTYTNSCDTSCNVCSATRTISHNYSGSCDTICNVCSAIRTTSASHTYTNNCDTTCNVCSTTRTAPHTYSGACDRTCNGCYVTRTTNVSHTYTNNCDTTCNVCSETRTAPHTYSGDCDRICNGCDVPRFSTTLHTYTNDCDADCNICHETRTREHTYTNDCDTTCNVCNSYRPTTHVYSNNCDNTCNKCGAIRTVGAHNYTNNCDTTCNYCNAQRTTKHTYSNACDANCNVCNATRAAAHTYKVTTAKATTSQNGSIVKKCTKCNNIASNTTIKYVKSFTLSTTDYTYNGKAKTPTVTVCDSSGKVLKKNTDYRVSYASGRKKVGKYKVKVTLKGNYSGTKTLNFQIKPTTKTNINLLVGATSKIGAKSNKKITYSSSNKKVVKVSSSGVLTAVKKGTANVTVKSNGISQKIKVTVKKPYVEIIGTKTVYLGGSVKLKTESNCKAKVKWSSSNTKVATVSSSGKVTAKKAGSATIYAKTTYKGKTYKDSYKVTVKKPTLKLNKSSATVYVGDSLQLTAIAAPSVTVKFKSSNSSVASVSSLGVVTPKDAGNATITAYFSYGDKTYSATCKLTVKTSGFKQLKQTILNSDIINTDGNHLIRRDFRVSNCYYLFGIIYNESKGCYSFTGMASIDVDTPNLTTLKFDLYQDSKTVDISVRYAPGSLHTIDATYTLNIEQYNKNQEIKMEIKENIIIPILNLAESKKTIKTFNDLCLSEFEKVLKENAGITLNDIGFTNY